tara:strand:- start:303 stop:860 length:558 start_codon:yes stop_codon:yes gene_type:complete
MKFICILLSFFFVGCASIDKPESEILSYDEYSSQDYDNFNKLSLSAKITLFVEKKGFSGKIFWLSRDNKSNISILNPFNAIVAKVYLDKYNNSLKISNLSNNKREVESLIKKIFGDKETVFIVEEMIKKPPSQLTSENNVALSYKDWLINYEGIKIKDGISFPKKIELNKNEITLKIFIFDWKID